MPHKVDGESTEERYERAKKINLILMGKIRKYLTDQVAFELDFEGQEGFGNRDVSERSLKQRKQNEPIT